jgi:hypothetical protein
MTLFAAIAPAHMALFSCAFTPLPKTEDLDPLKSKDGGGGRHLTAVRSGADSASSR